MTYRVSNDSRTAQDIAWAGLNISTSPGVWATSPAMCSSPRSQRVFEHPEIIDQARAPLCGPI